MIYLVITASLHNTLWSDYASRREQEYRSSIEQTLQIVPASIQPIIVENNGERKTFLEEFVHHGNPVPVLYTKNNLMVENKAVKEMMDVQAVIKSREMQADDWIIKLTGRYPLRTSQLLDKLIAQSSEYDAFIKFYSSKTRQFEIDDCIMGFYAARVSTILFFRPLQLSHTSLSPEQVFARYVRLSYVRLNEIDELGVRCIFSDTGTQMDV
jgi:hypothetical protein